MNKDEPRADAYPREMQQQCDLTAEMKGQLAMDVSLIKELRAMNSDLLDSVYALLVAAQTARLPMDLTVTIAKERAAKAERLK